MRCVWAHVVPVERLGMIVQRAFLLLIRALPIRVLDERAFAGFELVIVEDSFWIIDHLTTHKRCRTRSLVTNHLRTTVSDTTFMVFRIPRSREAGPVVTSQNTNFGF